MLTPGAPSRVAERTAHHAVGVFGDLVITCAFRGSEDDPRHLFASRDVLQAEAARCGRPVPWLVVFRDASISKPPSAEVRDTIKSLARTHRSAVAKVLVTIPGDGFGAATHRSVISTLATILQTSVPVRVVPTLEHGLGEVLGVGPSSRGALLFCERELLRDAPSTDVPARARSRWG